MSGSPRSPSRPRDALLGLEHAAGFVPLFLRRARPSGAAGPMLWPAARVTGELEETAKSLAGRLGPESARLDTPSLVAELALAAQALGASLRLLHAWPSELALAEPWRRAPSARAVPVLPWLTPAVDVELVALERGMRRLVKREGLDARARADFVERCENEGWVAAQTSGREAVCFVARDAAVLERALHAERALLAGGDSREAATLELGALLGYPRCCVEAFAELTQADDLSASVCRLPPWPARAPAFALWLDPSLRLVSHLGCCLGCEATASLSSELFDAIAPKMADPQAWLDLARRLHVIDAGGRHVALKVSAAAGDLEVLRVADARTVELSPDAKPRLASLPELHDLLLRPYQGGLRDADERFWAVLVADHRGPEGYSGSH